MNLKLNSHLWFVKEDSKEIKPTTRWLVMGLTMYLLFHFICTLTYCLEFSPPNRLTALRNQYMVPYFHQGWKLFAPDVKKDQYELDYRFSTGEEWSSWTSSEDFDDISSHPRLPYVAQKLELLLAIDMRRNLYFNEDSVLQYDLIVSDVPYMRVLYMAVRRHEILYQSRPDSLQLKLRIVFTPPFDGSLVEAPREFKFPVYTFPK
jgi:hypothetical protein